MKLTVALIAAAACVVRTNFTLEVLTIFSSIRIRKPGVHHPDSLSIALSMSRIRCSATTARTLPVCLTR